MFVEGRLSQKAQGHVDKGKQSSTAGISSSSTTTKAERYFSLPLTIHTSQAQGEAVHPRCQRGVVR